MSFTADLLISIIKLICQKVCHLCKRCIGQRKGRKQSSGIHRNNTVRKTIEYIKTEHRKIKEEDKHERNKDPKTNTANDKWRKKQTSQRKEQQKSNASNTRMTRVWAMPLIPALLCASVLVYSCLMGQPAFIGDLSLKGATVEILNNMTNKILGSLDEISLMTNRDTCDPINKLVEAGFKIALEILAGGVIGELKKVLSEVKKAFDIVPNITLDSMSFVFILPPLLGCLMFLLGFLVTLIPLPIAKKVTLLGTIERQAMMFASMSLTFYMTTTESFLALVNGVPLMNVAITNGPLVQFGQLVSFVLILAFIELKISQLIPIDK